MTDLIQDGQTLDSAAGRFGHTIRTYDDGFGPLWILRDSMGVQGIVRAATWEDAWGICEDEFMPDADPEDVAKFEADYGPDYEEKSAAWQENYGFRPNFNGTCGIYQKDLNGEALDRLTENLAKELEITVTVTSEEEAE